MQQASRIEMSHFEALKVKFQLVFFWRCEDGDFLGESVCYNVFDN